ncbi:MAG: sensor histidine kinase [Rhodocyclaceae bacterium]|nr:sensor histidine kinase [Rhodocyclaceae bacterium]
MLIRRQTIHAHLVTSFTGIVGLLLVIALTIALIWFASFQRAALNEDLRTYAVNVAAQSGLAAERKDGMLLKQNLAVLASTHNVRWAMIIQGKQLLAEYGQLPKDLDVFRNRPDQATEAALRAKNMIATQEIFHQGRPVGTVLIGGDTTPLYREFFSVAISATLLLLVLFLIALPVFHRLVRTVSEPLQQLARMSQLKSSFGDGGDTDAATRVGAGDTPSGIEVAPAEVERLGLSFDRMLASIADRDAQMRQSRDELRALNASLQAVRESERTRIAHEIHDELGQRLTAIKLDVARALPPTTEDGAHVAKMIDETVKVVREISWELRPSVLDSLGLTAAIEWLGEDFQRRMATRCKVQVPEPAPVIETEVATQLFRICQELLTNIARHAGASRVEINFSAGVALRLEVFDDGVGMKPRGLEQKSLGLLGIRERVHALGGKLRIETVPQIAGTRICVTVPGKHSSTQGGGEQR